MKMIALITGFFVSFTALAQSDLISIKYDGISETATTPSEAVREITQKATETTARNQVIELIGEAKFRKNKELIEKRIINQSSKFIPTTRPSQAAQSPKGYKVSVELKVSPDSLRKMVQSAGLLADTETPGTLISLVSFTNKTTELSYKWWAPEATDGKKDLAALSSLWQQTIGTELERKNFKIAKTQKQSFDERELVLNSQAQMIVRGEARVRTLEDGSGSLALKAGVYQATDSRLLADVTRTTKIPRVNEATLKAAATQMFADVAKELTASVHEAWQTGVVGSTAVQIAAVGLLTPKQLEDFKTEMNRTFREIKNLRERKFSAGRVVLEADFKGSLASLGEQLRKTQLPSFQTEVGSTEDNQIELRVKARR